MFKPISLKFFKSTLPSRPKGGSKFHTSLPSLKSPFIEVSADDGVNTGDDEQVLFLSGQYSERGGRGVGLLFIHFRHTMQLIVFYFVEFFEETLVMMFVMVCLIERGFLFQATLLKGVAFP